jgi:hypothetical protein
MIFSSRNEAGELASDLVMAGRKTVTRRIRPHPVGAVRAVQPGRTKKGVGFIKILSCVDDEKWKRKNLSGYGGSVLCSETITSSNMTRDMGSSPRLRERFPSIAAPLLPRAVTQKTVRL